MLKNIPFGFAVKRKVVSLKLLFGGEGCPMLIISISN